VIRLLAGYVRLVGATTRWEEIGAAHLDALIAEERGFIAGLWHGRLFMTPLMAPPEWRRVAVISNNRDGDLIAALVARFGAGAVRGSSFDRRKGRQKGGAAAYRAGLAELATPRTVLGVTPDGPRGPRMHAEPGIARLSAGAGAAVLPVAFSVRWGVVLGSWDAFLLPLPFGRGVKVYGPPLRPPEPAGPAELDRYRAAIEAAITGATETADRACGRAPVLPA
jgi:lysophospholipid acyltransferase (LPLAT)-like uncharacterized protein